MIYHHLLTFTGIGLKAHHVLNLSKLETALASSSCKVDCSPDSLAGGVVWFTLSVLLQRSSRTVVESSSATSFENSGGNRIINE